MMMLIHGVLSEAPADDSTLERLLAGLPASLAQPFQAQALLVAAARFCQQLEGGSLPQLPAHARRELLDFCRPQSLNAKRERELGVDPFALRRIDYTQQHFEAWRPLGVVLHVTPGNAPLLPFMAVVESLLVGNINWLRASAADQGLSARLLAALLACDPGATLAAQVAVLPLSYSQLPAYMAHIDALSVWGGDEALHRLRARMPHGCRWIDWGARISFAYLQPEAVDASVLDTLADEVCRYDQQACSSPQGVWVDSEDPDVLRRLAAGLAAALGRRSAAWPAPAPERLQAADMSAWQAFSQLDRSFTEVRGESWSAPGWRVEWQHKEGFEPGPLFRCVTVRPLPRCRLVATLRPWRRRLQSCGLAASETDLPALAVLLLAAGVGRIVPLADMHQAYAGAPHDGVYALTRLARRVSFTAPAAALPGRARLDLQPQTAPEGLPSLPIMSKSGFQRSLQSGAQLFFRSGGSSGRPKLSGFSYRDYHQQMRAAADGLFAAGLDPARDRVLNLLYAGHMYGGLLSFFTLLDHLQATHYPMGGPCDDDFSEIAQVIADQGIDTLIGMPGTVFQLFQRQAQALRAYGGIKKILLGGEHLGAAQRDYIQAFGVTRIRSALYGAVDAGPLGHACAHSPDGVFHLLTHCQWLEIVDIEHDRPVEPGECGRLLFTSLAREGQRVVRYDIGDLGRWLSAPCPCGNPAARFELLGRHGQLLRVGTAFVQAERLARRAAAPVQFIVDHAEAGHERLRVHVDAPSAEVELRLRADAGLQEAFACSLFELQVEQRAPERFRRSPSGKVPLVLDDRLRTTEGEEYHLDLDA